ncbi:MAG: hypothetical protein KAU58_06115, partial [Candidatus Omnitrophica bacterium]|nr:hypothetical protein [Candidatus Omnitrophota bacterium]
FTPLEKATDFNRWLSSRERGSLTGFTKKSDLNKFYDQIAWFTGKNNTTALPMKYLQGGSFDFTKAALKSRNLTKSELSWYLSDHYPLWAEFQVRE